MNEKSRILVIDDEPDMLDNCRLILSRAGYDIQTLQDSRDLSATVAACDPDLVLTDLMMPGQDGMAVLSELHWSHTDVPVVIMTAYATVETAVEAMKHGAADYLVKPFSKDQLLLLVQRMLTNRTLVLENQRLRRELDRQQLKDAVVAVSPAMQLVLSTITRVADTDASVLIQGESGTGKEVIARAIHGASRRSAGPFVAVNCSALPAQLIESELFGHEKGAFTGAVTTRKGLLEEAHGGTFFLDEVTEMDMAMQSKLLRVLQERKVRRVGGNREIDLDVRIIAASNRDAKAAVQQKLLREDLFFRLAVVMVDVPPLRQRREDIPVLAAHFLAEIAADFKRTIEGFSPQVLDRLTRYAWPGNVRELRNVVERAVSLATHPILREEDLPASLQEAPSRSIRVDVTESYEDAKAKLLDQFQREYFTRLIDEERGNITRVALRAGVDRRTIYRIMKGYGVLHGDGGENAT
ncbi:MAG TPA: sigma-54 dependent transcriptional regulator [bacterium]|jgi:DNA-binding NtrC family response regulator